MFYKNILLLLLVILKMPLYAANNSPTKQNDEEQVLQELATTIDQQVLMIEFYSRSKNLKNNRSFNEFIQLRINQLHENIEFIKTQIPFFSDIQNEKIENNKLLNVALQEELYFLKNYIQENPPTLIGNAIYSIIEQDLIILNLFCTLEEF